MSNEEVNEILDKKTEENYMREEKEVIDAISFDSKEVAILGSMSIRSQQYASDFDLYEVVKGKSLKGVKRRFQGIVKKLLKRKNLYIGDIKCGEYEKYEVLRNETDLEDYDYEKTVGKLKALYESGDLTKAEYENGKKLIKRNPSIAEWGRMQKELRFQVLRWSPADVLRGYLDMRDGERVDLGEAMKTGLFKLDCIAYIEDLNLYQEFSIIYDVRINGVRASAKPQQTEVTLKRDIQYYSAVGDWFKVVKRLFSYNSYLYRYGRREKHKIVKNIEVLNDLLNSDLGILNSVKNDLEVLLFLYENFARVPRDKVRKMVEGFVKRLSNVYSVNKYMKAEHSILGKIGDILTGDKASMENDIAKVYKKIKTILNEATKKRLNKIEKFISI